jgi:DNA-binding response OmpR family regulator
MKILLVEDQKKIVSFICSGLRSEGHTIDTALDGAEGLFLAEENNYDLLIIDVLLPGLDGRTLCQKLRKAGQDTPIIMLSALDSVEDRVKGLDAGADDYLTKPFSFEELLARIRALIRRHKGLEDKVLTLGELSLNPNTHEVSRKNKKINLSATEFKLLKYFMEHKNRVISKAMLLEKIWGYNFSPESNIVDVYIKYLRDKIDKGFKTKLLQTVRGIGYKLCA